jgi:predicted nucleic acid-binding protein
VAVCQGDHLYHDASIAAFLKFDKADAGCAAHSLAEVYSVLTRMPGQRRMTAAQAVLFLGTVRERLTIVVLDAAEYVTGIERLAAAGIVGGAIYDGILALCALKANAETIYTWNPRHFRLCGPEIASRLSTP